MIVIREGKTESEEGRLGKQYSIFKTQENCGT